MYDIAYEAEEVAGWPEDQFYSHDGDQGRKISFKYCLEAFEAQVTVFCKILEYGTGPEH